MEAARSQLGSKASRVQNIFITVDPERDTPEKVQAYVGYFGDDNVGLTGTPQEIAKVAAQFRMSYRKIVTDGSADYAVDHMDFIYLIDTQGRTRALYRSTTPAKKIASGVLSLLN